MADLAIIRNVMMIRTKRRDFWRGRSETGTFLGTKRNIWPPCTWICKNGRLSNHQKCNKEWFRAIHLLSMSVHGAWREDLSANFEGEMT
eukprot:scaffold28176_cov37-Cyclotella_meneghiniana.AAC.1